MTKTQGRQNSGQNNINKQNQSETYILEEKVGRNIFGEKRIPEKEIQGEETDLNLRSTFVRKGDDKAKLKVEVTIQSKLIGKE